MLPKYFSDIKDNPKEFFDKQYPDTDDCVILDKHIKDISVDIDEILKRQLGNYNEGLAFKGVTIRSAAKTYLQNILLKKQNLFSSFDCRNKIEFKRQDESASIFTEYASESDKEVLSASSRKQIGLILVGSVVLLATLYIFTSKNNV